MKLIELIKSSDMVLDRAGIEAPRLNIERMLEKILGLKRVDLYLNPDKEVSEDEENQLKILIDRRLKHEPLQYILGETEFYGVRLKCDRRALIPRPETEFVVSKGLEVIGDRKGLNILDLACGSGNIVVAMAVENPEQNYYASDLSADAIDLAKENAELNAVSDKINFLCGNIFSPFKDKNILFDIILANPPYIREGDFELLHEQIRRYEPTRALLSGESGLEFIKQMLDEAPACLKPDGYLIFEVALGQAVDIRDLVAQSQSFEFLETVVDYGGIDRVVVLKRSD
jgi:release factor glutamine methyltransferase